MTSVHDVNGTVVWVIAVVVVIGAPVVVIGATTSGVGGEGVLTVVSV